MLPAPRVCDSARARRRTASPFSVAAASGSCSRGMMSGSARRPVKQTRFELGGHEYIVVCLDDAPDAEPLALGELTRAEREVAVLVAEGLSSQAIAAQRGRSVRTVENQLAAIYCKLRVSSRAELVVKLSRCG